jgi:hypothetical protein
MTGYDPVPDAIVALQAKTPSQRHAIVRLLKPDGPSLQVLRWIVRQPDCDVATASMIFWRLRCLPPKEPAKAAEDRGQILELIVTRACANEYSENRIAWDGIEAWHRTVLVGAEPSLDWNTGEIPRALFGPFAGEYPEPAKYAFFEVPYEEDDSFDALWFINPDLAAAADWLIGKPAEVWMAAVSELAGAHPDELYLWMVLQPECPAPVAGQIFWLHDPVSYSRGMLGKSSETPVGSYAMLYALLGPVLDRWSTTGFVPNNLDFSRFASPAKYRALLSEFPGRPDPLQIPADLLDPVPGRRPEVLRNRDEFDFWYIERSLGAHVPRPRSAAVKEWNLSLKPAPPEPSRGWRWRDIFR